MSFMVMQRATHNGDNGDRLYCLSRTAGLSLPTQLEGNSLVEFIQRDTDVEGLPVDVFSQPA